MTAVDTPQWDDSVLLEIRKVLHVYDEEEVDKILLKYAEMMELFTATFPTMAVSAKVDWAMSVAMAPEWYGESLSTRINNTMLVSALLITVTVAILLYPPEYALSFDDDVQRNETALRSYFYLCSICNLCFIISIVLGVAFVENAMSRAYTEADKMILIAKNYTVLAISQVGSIVGAFLFVIVLIIPTFKVFHYADASIMSAVSVLLMVIMGYFYIKSNLEAGTAQVAKVQHFMTLVDADTGRLLGKFYPPGASVTREYFSMMYVKGEGKAVDSATVLKAVLRRNPRKSMAMSDQEITM